MVDLFKNRFVSINRNSVFADWTKLKKPIPIKVSCLKCHISPGSSDKQSGFDGSVLIARL